MTDEALRRYLRQQISPTTSSPGQPPTHRAVLLASLRYIAHLMAESRNLSPPAGLALPDEGMAALPSPPEVDWAGVDVRILGDLYSDLMAERHQQGSYYTPVALTKTVAQWTLSPLLEGRRPQKAIRVLDPAMGSAHFLIAAGEVLARWCRACHPDYTPAQARWAATDCLYGIDYDPIAVELAKISLWLWAALPGTTPAMLNDRLICGDALLDDGLLSGLSPPFDALIGNPPYASVFTRARSQPDDHRDAIRARYQTASGSFDLAVPFVEQALNLCREGGRCGLVLPNKLLAADYARPLRAWVAKCATIEAIIDYTRQRPFKAGVYPVVCIFRRQKPQADDVLPIYQASVGTNDPPTLLRRASQSDLHGTPGQVWSIVFEPGWDELRPCWQATIPLGQAATLIGGLTVGQAYDLYPSVTDAPPGELPEGAFRLVTSGLLRRYRTLWGQTPARYLKQTYHRPIVPAGALPPRRREQAASHKIIISGLSKHLRAVVDRGTMQASVGTTVILEARWPLGALCALLNSRLMARLYRALFGGLALNSGYLRFGKRELSLLPLPGLPTDDPRLVQLDALAGQITVADQKTRASLDNQIETLVCELYGLSDGYQKETAH